MPPPRGNGKLIRFRTVRMQVSAFGFFRLLEAIPDSNSAKAKRFMQEELVRWEPVVKAAGMKAQ